MSHFAKLRSHAGLRTVHNVPSTRMIKGTRPAQRESTYSRTHHSPSGKEHRQYTVRTYHTESRAARTRSYSPVSRSPGHRSLSLDRARRMRL
ncbi:hypothetical protein C8Q73DRAFT_678177 [Cubamyces lactineus]|nr:hypothetical protein C8Q73DRAFT_678177 [Cubamyces lactineus]